MSLTLAYNIARSALTTSASRANVVSINVANSDNPDAARKTALVATGVGGASYLVGIAGELDRALFGRALEVNAAKGQASAVAQALEQLAAVTGDPEAGGSPAALIGGLKSALQTASAASHDEAALQGVLTAASDLARGLNDASDLIMKVRSQANDSIEQSVGQLRSLLHDVEKVNRTIVTGTALGGTNLADDIDKRNGLVRSISELVDVSVVTRGDNDMTLYLANGLTLFETSPREIAFDISAPVLPGQPGPGLRIDGAPAELGGGIGGKIGGLLIARDDASLKLGRQLDEIARGLIVATAERDQSATPTLPDIAGLLTYDGGPALPPSGSVVHGLAGRIRVNANADPALGGALSRIRDGGISDPASAEYIYNNASGLAFNGRLIELIDNMTSGQPFDPATGLATSPGGVQQYAITSAGWLDEQRRIGADIDESQKVLADRALGAWQSRVGVNLDNELAALIALERSYQASTRLISSVNSMFDSLLDATR